MKSILKTVFLFISHLIILYIIITSYRFYEFAILSNSLELIILYYIMIVLIIILYFLFNKQMLNKKDSLKISFLTLLIPILYSVKSIGWTIGINRDITDTIFALLGYVAFLNIVYVTFLQNKHIYFLNKNKK